MTILFFKFETEIFVVTLHLSAVQHMKLTKTARQKWSKKQDSKHRCRLWCSVTCSFFYTFWEHIVLMIRDKKNPLSDVSHLDWKSQFLKTGFKLGNFMYNYLLFKFHISRNVLIAVTEVAVCYILLFCNENFGLFVKTCS